ncbi:hypothetical protein SAMN05444483_10912 [Salegentibacter echinorum]|uniref:Uncharacterized protein n=1 Tax=Salegentibacter echinorum TaxID=1073325 RepID=A0A1M5IWA5_SALEC|nr:hypothetical protein [Salegentibacter echinorum]SHG32566.1 hypothetical protein SAMN05444483_10912 [Salegentibacter echinorum]
MEIITILYITLAILVSLGFSFFQYFFRTKKRNRDTYIFATLRFLSVFILFLLFINPRITRTDFELEKANLFLAVDNSESIVHLKQQDTLTRLLQKLKNNQELQSRFEINQCNFGSELVQGTSPNFNEPQTNITAALKSLKELTREKPAAIILLSDGNQSLGRDFQYFQPKNNQQIFPVVLGDTAQYLDLKISRLNTNTYAFLNNRLPVEAILSYSGEKSLQSRFVIKAEGNVVFSEEVAFDAENNSAVIQAELPANRLGVLSYEAEIIPLKNEKNKLNNRKKFAVEVVDERSKILLATAISHPDLGAFKKSIEANEQRSLSIKTIDGNFDDLEDYQLVILYQPTRAFSALIKDIKKQDKNYLLVTGTGTNWQFVNQIQDYVSKDFSNQSQEIFALKNPNFNQFQFEDFEAEKFPPLEDKFGSLKIANKALQSIFFQKIENESTTQPLFSVSETQDHKTGFIFGENIWRWRAASFLKNDSFETFDNFMGKLVQNIASNKRRDRLTIDYQSFYYENEPIVLTANFFDQNYQFDPNANLEISVKKEGEILEAQLVLKNNNYTVNLGNLVPGNYDFTIKEKKTGIKRSGSFEIIAFNVEQQFNTANLTGMRKLGQNSATNVYTATSISDLINKLLVDDKYKPIQKSRENIVPLIDWHYLLFLLVLILAAEWFFRKYKGLI